MDEKLEKKCAVCGIPAQFKCTACKNIVYCCVTHQRKDWPQHKLMCRPFEILKSAEMGRYMVASRDIPAHSIIFIEEPLLIGPKWCLEENEKDEPYFPCVGCFQMIRIDGQSCPTCHWPACSTDCSGLTKPQLHGLECKILAMQRGPRPQDTTDPKEFLNFYRSDALMALRCIMLQHYFPDKWMKVQAFESHDQQRIGTKYYEEANDRIVSFLLQNYFNQLSNTNSNTSGTFQLEHSGKTIHRICGIFDVNALNIELDSAIPKEVSALFEYACILEHSCSPNCYYTFNAERQHRITMRAGCAIKKGEHLSIMYTHMLWGTQMRQEHLRTNKYFTCQCNRCADRTELGSFCSALQCLGDVGKSCDGIIMLINPLDADSDWFCNKCTVLTTSENVDVMLSNVEEEVDALMNNCTATVNEIEALILKLEKLLHPNHYHLFAMKHALIQRYGHEKGLQINELSNDQLKRKIEMCQKLLEITNALDPHHIRLYIYTGVIFYELYLGTMEENRREGVQINDEKFSKRCMDTLKGYLMDGRFALKLGGDSHQCKKLIELFDIAAANLGIQLETPSEYLEKDTIS